MNITLVQTTPNPVETIAQIASICYDSDPKDPMKLVKHLYAGGHHSVFEHISFLSVRVKELSVIPLVEVNLNETLLF